MPVKLSRGDIVLVRFPFTDLSETSLRPALIVSKEQIGQDIILAAISSIVRDSVFSDCIVNMDHPEFGLTGLRVTSVLRLHKLVTVDRSTIIRRIGYIGPRLQDEVDIILRLVLGLGKS